MEHRVTILNCSWTETVSINVRGRFRRGEYGRSDCLVLTKHEMTRLCMLMLYWHIGDCDGVDKFGNSFFCCDDANTTYIDIGCESDGTKLVFRTASELVERYTQHAGRDCVFTD